MRRRAKVERVYTSGTVTVLRSGSVVTFVLPTFINDRIEWRADCYDTTGGSTVLLGMVGPCAKRRVTERRARFLTKIH